MDKVKLTLENRYGSYTVELNEERETLDWLIQFVLIPVLLAAGYSENTIRDYIPE